MACLSLGDFSPWLQNTISEKVLFHHLYSPEELWCIIPQSMQSWWVNSIQFYSSREGICPRENCTLSESAPMFKDETLQSKAYAAVCTTKMLDDVTSFLNNDNIMIPNVLCSFGCTAYCFDGVVKFGVIS
jgi:hypothetical protein